MSAARVLVSVEDSYMKWNEGPTSMDVMTDPESVIMHVSDPPKSKRSLPPLRKVRSIHCMVPKHAAHFAISCSSLWRFEIIASSAASLSCVEALAM